MANNQTQSQAAGRTSPLAGLTPDQRRKYYINWTLDNLLYIILIVFVLVSVAAVPSLRKGSHIFKLISLAAQYLPLACGMAGCIILSGADLSAGRMVGFTALVTAVFMQPADAVVKKLIGISPLPVPVTFIIVLAIGFAFGAVNGFFVAKFKMSPFLVTLCTSFIIYAGAQILFMSSTNNSGNLPPVSLDSGFKNVISGFVFNFENGIFLQRYVLYAAIFVAVIWFLWNKTRFGKNMFAVGSNSEAASASGINVGRTTILVYALAGLCFAYTGFIESARLGLAFPNIGIYSELDGIAACVIGGVSFKGGIGKISGVIAGVFLLQFVGMFLSEIGLTEASIVNIVKCGIVLLACALSMRKRIGAK